MSFGSSTAQLSPIKSIHLTSMPNSKNLIILSDSTFSKGVGGESKYTSKVSLEKLCNHIALWALSNLPSVVKENQLLMRKVTYRLNQKQSLL